MSAIPEDNDLVFDQWRQARLEEINACPEGWCWRLILDPCTHEDLPDLITMLDPALKAWPLYLNTYSEDAGQYGPQLIELYPQSPFLEWALGQMEQLALGLLLFCEKAKSDELYEHLQNLFEVKKPDDRTVLFRYYDPRLFHGIISYADPAPGLMLLGPALHVKSWEPGRALPLELSQPRDTGWRCAAEGFVLDQALDDHLWSNNQIHAVIRQIETNDGGVDEAREVESWPKPMAYAFVEQVRRSLADFPLDNFNLWAASILALKNGFDFLKLESTRSELGKGRESAEAFKWTLLYMI